MSDIKFYLVVLTCLIYITAKANASDNFKKSSFSFGREYQGDQIVKSVHEVVDNLKHEDYVLYDSSYDETKKVNYILVTLITNAEAIVISKVFKGDVGTTRVAVVTTFKNLEWLRYRIDFIGKKLPKPTIPPTKPSEKIQKLNETDVKLPVIEVIAAEHVAVAHIRYPVNKI